jgi:hypothetical protein
MSVKRSMSGDASRSAVAGTKPADWDESSQVARKSLR